jgi:hypothetical protein
MFCPQCGQQQVSQASRFCPRCGLPLVGVAQLLSNGGSLIDMSTAQSNELTPKQRGTRMGLMMMLLTLLVVPVLAIITHGLAISHIVVPLSAIILFWGGVLRIIYAKLFEAGPTSFDHIPGSQPFMPASYVPPAVSEAPRLNLAAPPNPVPFPRRRETGELRTPASVTENTTRLLEKTPDNEH